MKLVVLLLICCASVTLQQDYFWHSPYSWLPQYMGYHPSHHQPLPKINQPVLPPANLRNKVSQKDSAQLLKLIEDLRVPSRKTVHLKEVESAAPAREEASSGPADAEARIKVSSSNKDKPEDRGFGGLKWLGLNALLNAYTAPSSTSTAYSTTYSTLTVGTVVSCYTRTMFLSTTPCRRRKRKMLPGLLLGDDGVDGAVSPSKPESIEASLELEAHKTRESRAADLESSKIILQSSIQETEDNKNKAESTNVRLNRQQPRLYGYGADSHEYLDLLEETVFVSTSLLTSFAFYTSTATSTIVRLAATTAMSCLPACFTLC